MTIQGPGLVYLFMCPHARPTDLDRLLTAVSLLHIQGRL